MIDVLLDFDNNMFHQIKMCDLRKLILFLHENMIISFQKKLFYPVNNIRKWGACFFTMASHSHVNTVNTTL